MQTYIHYSRIEKTKPTDFISTSYAAYHMELDRYRPGSVIYTEKHALMTSDGTTTHLIAGNSSQRGYREGVGADARFYLITGFTQISAKRVVVADYKNHCVRLIDRASNTTTSVFSGQCESPGYQDGRQAKISYPTFVVMDQKNKNQLLIAEERPGAVRTVDVNSQATYTFEKTDILRGINYITQDEKSGDLYVTAYHAIYKIRYLRKGVTLIAGSYGMKSRGYTDGKSLDSLFHFAHDLIFITPQTLLVGDVRNNKLRLLDMYSNKVTTLNVTNSLNKPASLLLTNNSLYVGQNKAIIQYKCEYVSIKISSKN